MFAALLFFGSFIITGVIGLWLWTANTAAFGSAVFGAPNQVAAGAPGAVAAAAPSGAAPKPGEAAPAGGQDAQLVARGQQLANQFGCLGCHTTTGQPSAGPTWKGLAGHEVTLDNGQTVVADDAYLRESITNPDAKIVKGFSRGVMSAAITPYATQLQQPDNLEALIAYIKSLR